MGGRLLIKQRQYSVIWMAALAIVLMQCSPYMPAPISDSSQHLAPWSLLESIDVDAINADIVPGKLTLDVGIYFPSNFDSSFNKVSLESMIAGLKAAKEIYKNTGVQINLLWIKTADIDPRFLSIQANEVPGVPNTGYINLYQHSARNPARLTQQTKDAFTHIIEPDADNHRTVYLIALQDVFYPFLTVSEGRNWTMKTVRTGGLSFPAYSYPGTIPNQYRGAITITNLQRPDRQRRTIAHEIGHKVMNVSHEYMEISPEHEVYADGGLMVYGAGEEIPSGKEGRWHLERLRISPYLYVLEEDGSKTWNDDFAENGHYYDPIYGEYVIHFAGTPPIAEDW